MQYTLKAGDLIEHKGRIALITKIRHKSCRYYICDMTTDGAFFDCKKQIIYDSVDKGDCAHHLAGGTTKYRRKRK